MVNVALIGLGYWGKKIYNYLEGSDKFNLKYVYTPSLKDCREYTNNLSAIWNDKKVSAIIIATPIDTHYKIAKEALRNNKHVFSEKPLALQSSECRKLKRIAQKKGLVILTDYTWTFSKSLEISQTINLGEIKGIELEIKQMGRFLKWDVYWLLASHLLAILDMFVSLDKLNFQAFDIFQDRGFTETGLIMLQNRNVRGTISASINCINKSVKLIIYGTRGTMIYDPLSDQHSLEVEWYRKQENIASNNLPRKRQSFRFDEKNNLNNALNYFYACLLGKKEANINRAVMVTDVLEKIQMEKKAKKA